MMTVSMSRVSRRPGSATRERRKVRATCKRGSAALFRALFTEDGSTGGVREAASGVGKATVVSTVFVASLTRSTREASSWECDTRWNNT